MTLATEKPVETFESLEPRTGNVVGTFPINTAAEVEAAVARAREAFAWWQQLGWNGRRERLDAWKRLIVRRGGQVELFLDHTGLHPGQLIVIAGRLDTARRCLAHELYRGRVQQGRRHQRERPV